MLFNNTDHCYDYTVPVTDELMCMEHWWKCNDRETEILEEKPLPVIFHHHKFNMDWPGIEPELLQ
jgi:hypothetical protein